MIRERLWARIMLYKYTVIQTGVFVPSTRQHTSKENYRGRDKTQHSLGVKIAIISKGSLHHASLKASRLFARSENFKLNFFNDLWLQPIFPKLDDRKRNSDRVKIISESIRGFLASEVSRAHPFIFIPQTMVVTYHINTNKKH